MKEIGFGGYGKVYSAVSKKSFKTFAIKIVRIHFKVQDAETEILKHQACREVEAMAKISSNYTVKLDNWWFEELSTEEQ